MLLLSLALTAGAYEFAEDLDPETHRAWVRHRRGDRTVLAGLLIPPSGAAVIGVAALASGGNADLFVPALGAWLGVSTAGSALLLTIPGALQSTRGARELGARVPYYGFIVSGLGLGVLGGALYTAVSPDMPSSLALTLTGTGLIMAGSATQALYAGGRARSVLVAPRVSRGGVGLGVGGAF